MSKRSKKHHYVPQVLQKQFLDIKTKNIWYSKREEDGKFSKPELRNTKSTFMKRDYYTVLENGKPSDAVEKELYGEIDNLLGLFLPKIIEIFNHDKIPHFTEVDLYNLKFCIWEMRKRTPDFVNNLLGDDELGGNIVQGISESAHENRVSKEFLQFVSTLKTQKRQREIGRDTRVKAIIRTRLDRNKDAADEMAKRSDYWAVSDGKHSFILSSRMVFTTAHNIRHPESEIWMPITPKIAIGLLKDSENKIQKKYLVNEKFIRNFNEAVVANSDEIASHSRYLLESLIKRDTGQSPSPSTDR